MGRFTTTFFRTNLLTLLGPCYYEWLQHLLAHRRVPKLKKPITFNDKIGHRKLFQDTRLDSIISDKWLVRDYVASKIGDIYLSKVFFCGGAPETIQIEQLPERFVMKATHGSGPDFIHFFPPKNHSFTEDGIRTAAAQLLKQGYGKLTNEKWYTQIRPRILVEEWLHDEIREVPLDYKFFVYNGTARFIQVDYNRLEHHTRTFYDIDWRPQPFSMKYPAGPVSEKPKTLLEMIHIAEHLAEGLEFVRVDLYSIGGKRIVFGEMTLAPEAGWGKFSPAIWDFTLRKIWSASSSQ
jgi:hypothetical protein